VANDDPPTFNARDDASASRYGDRTYSRTDLIHNTDSWSQTLATAILRNDAWPTNHPQAAAIDIRTDPRAADLLLSAEIANTIRTHDSGHDFLCVIAGYSFTLNRAELSGSLVLQDVTGWQAAGWDTGQWDTDRWGLQ
jgi:hypothetical protein